MKNAHAAVAAAGLLLLSACGSGGGSDSPAAHPPSEPPASETTVEPPITIPDQPPVPGEVRVIDGDTVEIDGTPYRLFGIDAPERYQKCRTWGRTWACGAAATEALVPRAAGMTCEGSSTDRWGRVVGVCFSGGEDLNAWLVANGWALAATDYSEDYADEEEQARSEKRGIHRGEFIEPWNWRRGEKLDGVDSFAAIASGPLDVSALVDRMLRDDNAGIYGRWLDHSVFAIVNDTVAVSFGGSPLTNPGRIGGGVWNGSLVGMDMQNRMRVEGDAAIDIDDFTRPDVDVAFTGIEDARGRGKADIHWENIAVTRNAFQARGPSGSIEGRFYGSNHQEVGGIFAHTRLLGAFGASR